MTKSRSRYIKRLLTILPVAAAVVVAAYLMMHRTGPVRKPAAESVSVFRVITVPLVNLVPGITGYGVAEPGRIWEAVAEVAGTVVSIDPHLKSGKRVDAESVLIKLDSTEYKLAAARLEAGVKETRAHIKELAEDKQNIKSLIAVEQRSLKLAKKALERNLTLLKRNAVSQNQVDQEERNFLQQKKIVRELENRLSLIPSKIEAFNAAMAVQQANLKQAEIDLAKTIIKAPFDCRLGDVNIEAGQFLRTGQSLFKAFSIDVTEIDARFRIEQIRNLLSRSKRTRFQPGLNSDGFKQLFSDINVLVSLQSGDLSIQWKARIDRLREVVDPKTREIKVVAAVDRPYEKIIPGVRPPLTPGMFCKVELMAPVRPESIVLPRSARHENYVFIVDHESRLQKKQVVVDFAQSEFVVIKSGLAGGETIIVSDPSPAIIGMKVAPVPDDSLLQHLRAISRGKEVNK
ncbi:MAG: hypothetical protein U9N77_06685 [Thermodesulfobacteriota bacterium]|nr:hypothetical protein [Thermodesulfobacteriota bacterium]